MLRAIDWAASAKARVVNMSFTGPADVDGPRAGGLYRIRLGERTMEAHARDAAIARLKVASSVIRLLVPETPSAH